MATELNSLDEDLVNQTMDIGKTYIQSRFYEHYGDLFDGHNPDLSGFGKPEVYEPIIIEQYKKVIGFSLPATLITDDALNFRLLDLPKEVSDYIRELGPNKVATTLCSWINPQTSITQQLCVANIIYTHMHNLMKKSPAEVILSAPLDYNPQGISLDNILNKKNGFIQLTDKDMNFVERHKNEAYSKEIMVSGRRSVSIKGLTQASRAKIEKFEDRYQTLAQHA